MIGTHDPEGVERRTLHDLVDFNGKGVFEVGCGEGRMTWLYADAAASVLGFDPNEDSIALAREQTPDARTFGNTGPRRCKVDSRGPDRLHLGVRTDHLER